MNIAGSLNPGMISAPPVAVTPLTGLNTLLDAESGDDLITEAGDNLITEQ